MAMRDWVFELAVAAVADSPPDSIVNRLVRSFALLADCPMAILVVPRAGGQEIISSYGIPSTFRKRFVKDAPTDEALHKTFRIIDNVKENPLFRDSRSVHGALDIDFIAIAPVGFPFFNYGVHVIMGDYRKNVSRRSDLLDLMRINSEILSHALIQQGEIAVLERQIDTIRNMGRRFSEMALNSSESIAILDEAANIIDVSKSFKSRFNVSLEGESRLEAIFANNKQNIEKALVRMRDEKEPISALRVTAPDNLQEEMLTILSVAPDGPHSPNFVCHIRPLFFSRPDDPFTSELVAKVAEPVSISPFQAPVEAPSVTVRFLSNTLIKQPRLASRKGTSYHSVRRWRLPIKDYQIEALKALKSEPPAEFVDLVSRELLEAANMLFGDGSFDVVVPIPCGHSGPNCLSRRLSVRIAELARIPQLDAFHPIRVSGSSHPKTNARRDGMELAAKVTGHILLVDDVATSGSHLVEATNKLRRAGGTVFPLAWIGG